MGIIARPDDGRAGRHFLGYHGSYLPGATPCFACSLQQSASSQFRPWWSSRAGGRAEGESKIGHRLRRRAVPTCSSTRTIRSTGTHGVPEAFEAAKREKKLIFLSIGYSSCHWCHVMERESFASVEIAKLLNDNFVCIKVDREERPDIDDIYMTRALRDRSAGRLATTMILTADGKPIFGGTYFLPPTGGR